MVFNILHTGCRGNDTVLIKVADIPPEVRVVGNPPKITFKMSELNWIKSNQSSRKALVGFGYCVTC